MPAANPLGYRLSVFDILPPPPTPTGGPNPIATPAVAASTGITAAVMASIDITWPLVIVGICISSKSDSTKPTGPRTPTLYHQLFVCLGDSITGRIAFQRFPHPLPWRRGT